jgi:hypothetical protein
MSLTEEQQVFQAQSPDADRGQILAIVAAGLLVLIAFIGLIIDGGHAWSEQRSMQNGTDAVSEAGAVVIGERLGGATRTDADVLNAIENTRLANNIQVPAAYYTDNLGTMLTPSGGTTGSETVAARVGGGTIPPFTQGVRAIGRRTFETLVAGVVGINQWTTAGEATAIAGPPSSVAEGGLLPVTFPVNQIRCDGSNNVEYITPIREYVAGVRYIFPLCKNGPGNIGWLDWVPPYGGASELADAVLTPSNPAIDLPSWQGIAQTGGINSSQLENALQSYVGQTGSILLFDSTCDILPTGTTLDACPDENVGGTGTNQSYHVPKMMSLTIEAVYTNGNPEDPSDPGAAPCAPLGKHCMIGTITEFATEGTVGQVTSTDPLTEVRIQLID